MHHTLDMQITSYIRKRKHSTTQKKKYSCLNLSCSHKATLAAISYCGSLPYIDSSDGARPWVRKRKTGQLWHKLHGHRGVMLDMSCSATLQAVTIGRVNNDSLGPSVMSQHASWLTDTHVNHRAPACTWSKSLSQTQLSVPRDKVFNSLLQHRGRSWTLACFTWEHFRSSIFLHLDSGAEDSKPLSYHALGSLQHHGLVCIFIWKKKHEANIRALLAMGGYRYRV